MKKLLRILKWLIASAAIIIVCGFIAGSILYNKQYDAPFPDIHASSDSAVIAQGKHLVLGSARCVKCHYKPDDSLLVIKGQDIIPAGGGFPFEFPGGKFYSPNISSDEETGIGNLSDGQIARSLRYGVKSDGKALIPVMEFQNISDEDLRAIISYLRTVPPVKYKVPDNDFNLFGKAIMAFFMRPVSPGETPPLKVTPDTTVEYGRYIAGSVSSCRACHTERNNNTGEYTGEELAGGIVEAVRENPSTMIIASNLTPDPETGHIYNWTFKKFKDRFKQGKLIPQSIMPWGQFKHLNETELLAVWKYLHSVKPVHKENGPPIQRVKSY